MMSSVMSLGKVPMWTYRPSSCSYPCHSELFFCPQPYLKQSINIETNLKEALFFGQSVCHYRLKPVAALSSEEKHPTSREIGTLKRGNNFEKWDSMTAKFAGAANIPFLLLQLPQIILNARNLLAGNKSALLAVPWLGMLTGLLGNLSLLSYFIKKRETEAVMVQTLGVVSMYVVILQLAIAEAMPLPHFIVTSIVVASGLILNCMKYFYLLNPKIWTFWEDFITIGGFSALPQVMWSTFVPYVPNTIFPGVISFVTAVTYVLMRHMSFVQLLCRINFNFFTCLMSAARMGKLSDEATKFLGLVSGWTATLLFMWMPVAQMWTNFLNSDNIRGLSAVSMLLAMIGNGLMIPRALFVRDLMWFTGSSWACVFYGWGNLMCLYCFNCISREFFLAATLGFIVSIGTTLWRDTQAHGHSSPVTSLKELVFSP